MTPTELRANEERCRQILECKHQVNYWKAKLEVLEEEQELHIKLARLRLDAPATWRLLSRQERLEKQFILAALESDELPSAFEDFPNRHFPHHIRLDRDILMARVAHKDFAQSCTHERIFVPPKLRGDKEVILAMMKHHPQVIESMACKLRDDEEILQAVLAREKLPAHFLQHFSKSLRSSPETALTILKHPDGLSSISFCSNFLRNDKDFFLRALDCGNHTTENQVLRFASQRLREDYDVVYNSVCKSGMNLKHASYDLRRNEKIVVAATTQNPAAFRYCLPSAVKQDLLQDISFVKKMVCVAPASIMKTCIDLFQEDKEVALLALSNGLEWSAIPESLQGQSEFVLEAIRRSHGEMYMDLPSALQDDVEVALRVVKCESADNILCEAMKRCPELLSNRDAMIHVARSRRIDVLQQTLPIQIKNDKAIMLEAVKTDAIALDYCSDELQNDKEVILAAVESAPISALFHTEHLFQMENPDVVIRAFEKAHCDQLWVTYDAVCEDLWSNRDVAMAWFSKGGHWLADDFPVEFCDDKEMLITIARQNWTEFDWASESLKRDKEFMLQVLAVDGRVIRDVDVELRCDEDLVLAAISKDPRSLEFYSGGEDFEFMVSFAQKIRDRLREHDMFQEEIMTSMAVPFSNSICSLPMLNQGPTTLAMYEERISSFLGILRDDEEIAKYRAASLNLFSWGM